MRFRGVQFFNVTLDALALTSTNKMLFFILSMLCYVIYVQGEIKVLLLFVILRDVVLIKTKSALLPSYEHYMLHVIVL